MKKTFSIFLFFLLAGLFASCQLSPMGTAEASSGGVIKVSDDGKVYDLLVITLRDLEFNESAKEVFFEGADITDLLASKDDSGLKIRVVQTVEEGDSRLVLRVSGELKPAEDGSFDSNASIKIKKSYVTSTKGGAFNGELTVGVALTQHPQVMLTPEVLVSGLNYSSFSEANKVTGSEITLNLVNLKFSDEAMSKLKAGSDIKDLIIDNVKAKAASDWLTVTVVEAPDANRDRVRLSIMGAPPVSSDYVAVFSIAGDWFDKKSDNVYDPDELYIFNYKFVCEKKAWVKPEIKDSGSKALSVNAGEDISGTLRFELVNVYFNEIAEEELYEESDLSYLNAVSGLPNSVKLKVAKGKGIKHGDNVLELSISGKISGDAPKCNYSVTISQDWLVKTRSNVEKPEDFVFKYVINVSRPSSAGGDDSDVPDVPESQPDDGRDSGTPTTWDEDPDTGDKTPVKNPESAPPELDDDTGSSGGSGGGGSSGTSQPGVNSMELAMGKNTLNTGSAKNLYTITIAYPEGQYTGRTTSNYTIKGEGNTRKAGNLLESKGVPSGNANWNDMFGFTFQNMPKTTGLYWFTDETNKIKYYIDQNIYNGIWPAALPSGYWDNLKNGILSSKISGKNTLKAERDAFGLEEYDKDGTPYFYVIFCDFGDGTAGQNGGTAGVYTSANIRGSNNADIFYVNARFTEAFCGDYFYKNGRAMSYGVDTAVSTLLHEYMHYLMDANRLKKMEAEGSPRTQGEYYSSMLHGSLFWIEGTANHAPYRVIGDADASGVSSWLNIMQQWRPPINGNDSGANAGNSYAVYGAGGLFFSYVAEKYGTNTENRFHAWRESFDDIRNRGSEYSSEVDFVGNINNIVKKILGKEFKDEYVAFLCQCMSAMSDSVALPGCKQSGFKSPVDWGFVSAAKESAYVVSKASKGSSMSGLPELSFVINKWNEIPDSITLSGSNVKSYAMWF